MTRARPERVTVDAVVEVIRRHLADLLVMEPGEIDPDLPLSAYGLDSQSAVSLVAVLEDWSGAAIDAAIVFDRPSATELAEAAVAAVDGRPA
ncbi:acyl carrier protein [Nocardiopsis sediminis]|uniref:Acyl carrier protein n=1 Tax=Nocardiopsis sediminis TaxID=1778267 RepID=A0ABV8FLX1_9ACTN